MSNGESFVQLRQVGIEIHLEPRRRIQRLDPHPRDIVGEDAARRVLGVRPWCVDHGARFGFHKLDGFLLEAVEDALIDDLSASSRAA